jgi:hypothetical protein
MQFADRTNTNLEDTSMTETTLLVFTAFHVALSLIGIASGLIVVRGFLSYRLSGFWNQLFLWTTGMTAVTGFLFPFHGITPGIVIGVVCLLSLAVAVAARRSGSTRVYVAVVCFAEALNIIVLIAQSFAKIPALHGLAPTGREPLIAATQLLSLFLFIALAWIGGRRLRES